ncbi:MAG: NUDIX hydrolase [Polyangiaceae bacterium]
MKQARATKVAEPHQAALEEAAFLAAYRPGDFARPSVTVDVVAFTMIDALLRVLLVRRAQPPFKGYWALPGGFVRVGDGQREQGESLEAAVSRELEEETGLRPSDVYLEQLGAFGAPYRDPRMRVISVAFYALLRPDLVARVRGGGDANAAEWVEPSAKLRLAFDHATILAAARERLRERVRSTSIAASLLPPAFTIPEIRHVYSTLIGERQDPGNFRRRFLGMIDEGIVERAPGKRITMSKPAAVYRFCGRRS